MCMITLYRGSVKEENKLAESVAKYSIDLDARKLTVYPMLKEPQEFEIKKNIAWDETNDSMIIE